MIDLVELENDIREWLVENRTRAIIAGLAYALGLLTTLVF